MSATIVAASRLHIGLLDLGRLTPRAYGGAGVMVDGPVTTVTASASKRWGIDSAIPLDNRTTIDIRAALQRLSQYTHGRTAMIVIENHPRAHIGLGTKTSLILSTLVATCAALGISLDVPTIQHLSGRGGTSGIGLHGFFRGGFIADSGHTQADVPRLGPSSSRRPERLPLLSVRLAISLRWVFDLLVPEGTVRHGRSEAKFFAANLPLPCAEIRRAIVSLYHGIVPAVASGDIASLREALAEFHRLGFKARELINQTAQVRRVYRRLRAVPDVAVGLSSLGPLIYVVRSRHNQDAHRHVLALCDSLGVRHLGSFGAANRGHRRLR